MRGAAGGGSDRSAALFALVVIFGALQHVFRFHDAVVGVLLGAGRFGDHHGVARLKQIERHVGLRLRGGQLVGRHVDGVLSAFEHVELGVDGFFEAFGFWRMMFSATISLLG